MERFVSEAIEHTYARRLPPVFLGTRSPGTPGNPTLFTPMCQRGSEDVGGSQRHVVPDAWSILIHNQPRIINKIKSLKDIANSLFGLLREKRRSLHDLSVVGFCPAMEHTAVMACLPDPVPAPLFRSRLRLQYL